MPALAERHRVVAIELQGHGRTTDSDRPLSLERLADDVAEVLTQASVERADVLGFSLGGLVSVELARRHPQRLRRLVLASVHTSPQGYHDDITSPDARPGIGRMPTEDDFRAWQEAYRTVAPEPDHFEAFAAKASAWVASLRGWSEEELGQVHPIVRPAVPVWVSEPWVCHAVCVRGSASGVAWRAAPGEMPTVRLNARLNAASDS
ncbi:MAG: alpha/beta fold hydrolase [Acidimicrobiales bacterium]